MCSSLIYYNLVARWTLEVNEAFGVLLYIISLSLNICDNTFYCITIKMMTRFESHIAIASPVVCPSGTKRESSSLSDLDYRFIPHPSDCRRFYFCQTTIPRPLECEQHLAFDLETLSCIDKSLVPRWYTTRRPIIIPQKTMTINLKHKIFIDIQFQLKGSGHVYSRPRLASHWAYTNYTTKCRPSMDAKMKRTKQIQEI